MLFLENIKEAPERITWQNEVLQLLVYVSILAGHRAPTFIKI